MTENDIERMLEHKTLQTEIIEQFNEEEDKFVFDRIVPFCEQTTKIEISKADLQEALTVWMAYKSGKLVWKNVGKWYAKDFHTCYCSYCNFTFDIMKCDFIDKMRFCPNCGAKMKGAEEWQS